MTRFVLPAALTPASLVHLSPGRLVLLALLGLAIGACAPSASEVPVDGESTSSATADAPVVEEDDSAPGQDESTEPEGSKEVADDAGEISPAVGIYKGFFPGASSPGLDISLYLNYDGSLRMVSDYLNEEAPIEEAGTWVEEGGTVTITITGRPDAPYDEPTSHRLSLEEEHLTSTDWIGPWWSLTSLAMGLEPPYDAAGAASSIEERGFLGYYKHFAPSASCCGQDYTLLLGIDDLARLTTNFHNDEPPIVDVGTWSVDEEGRARVLLTGREGGSAYAQPITFALAGRDGLLEAVDYDERTMGEAGLTFYHYPALAMAQYVTNEAETDTGESSAGEGGESNVSADEPAVVGTTWELQEMQLDDGSVLSPGAPADYTLLLQEDGTAAIKADCNQGRGRYERAEPSFSIEAIALTRAMCPPGSLSDPFVMALDSAESLALDGDSLVVTTSGGGRLRFAAAAE